LFKYVYLYSANIFIFCLQKDTTLIYSYAPLCLKINSIFIIHTYISHTNNISNPHWARVVGYGPFSLWVIHKEGLCPSSGDINRLMMISLTLCPRRGSRGISDIPPRRLRFTKIILDMNNTADVTGGKPIAF
jgi:hypothetical protein